MPLELAVSQIPIYWINTRFDPTYTALGAASRARVCIEDYAGDVGLSDKALVPRRSLCWFLVRRHSVDAARGRIVEKIKTVKRQPG